MGYGLTDFLPNDRGGLVLKANGIGGIKGLSVLNQSTATVGVYLSRNFDGLPDVQIAPGIVITLPVDNLPVVGIRYTGPGDAPLKGSVRFSISEVEVGATMSGLNLQVQAPQGTPTSSGTQWDVAAWDTGTLS